MMPIRCVVDASVGVKLFIPDPVSASVSQLFGCLETAQTQIDVPDLFYIESANALWKYIRAKQLTLEQVQVNLRLLKKLPLQSTPTVELMTEAVIISSMQDISTYDACYIALAQKVKAPLLTLDRKLVNAVSTTEYDVRLFMDFATQLNSLNP